MEICFNSNMVRLKASQSYNSLNRSSCFNSNMVRLKDWNTKRRQSPVVLFQFQYGTIKRKARLVEMQQYLICFNSNMVRLKAKERTKLVNLITSFNSNMVRLKGNRRRFGSLCWCEFQFQYGTIKRNKLGVHQTTIYRVSIPIWYD